MSLWYYVHMHNGLANVAEITKWHWTALVSVWISETESKLQLFLVSVRTEAVVRIDHVAFEPRHRNTDVTTTHSSRGGEWDGVEEMIEVVKVKWE